MNAPENFELFNIPEGRKKYLFNYKRVEFAKDEKLSDSGIFTILLEDHTLGNLVKMYYYINSGCS